MRRVLLGPAAAFVLLVCGGAWSATPKIAARPLTLQEIAEYGLPEGTQISGGLFTVGVGSPVYLEALVGKGIAVSGLRWSLSGPSGSTAKLVASPLGAAVPIFTPGEREDYEVAGRQLLIPDKVGQYAVTANLDTNGVALVLTATVTAANYVGVGGVAGAQPTFPQCILCHAEQTTQWRQTGHATFFAEAIDGRKSSHYGENCIQCHTVGFDQTAAAVNGGFDDVAKQKGWTFPAELKAGNWDAMPAELKAVSNIQCENCHGPGSEHKGDPAKISVSLGAGDCAQCHDEEPYHVKNQEWNESRHAAATRYPTGEGRGSCVICHSGVGFIQRLKEGLDITQSDYAAKVANTTWEAITCQTCHDPHDATNPYQLRKVDEVVLMNGKAIAEGGTGKLCMNCHKARRNAETYVAQYSSHFGPHYSVQADMLAGTNGVEYGQQIRSSSHLYAVEDACATCHMQAVARQNADGTANPIYTHAGGHTFKPVWDNGTPDNPSDDVDLTAACANCHGPIDSFDIPREDFDGDRVVEGVQTEVEGLMHELAIVLPPIGEPTVAVTQDYTPQQLKAAYNYLMVEEDGSRGIHNTRYAVGLLKASLKDLTGREVVTAVETELVAARPSAFALAQNHPNPFNPETEIRYAVPEPVSVRLEIFNSLGQPVRTLVNAHHAVGEYQVRWDGRDANGQQVTAGVYICAMRAGSFAASRKMVFLP